VRVLKKSEELMEKVKRTFSFKLSHPSSSPSFGRQIHLRGPPRDLDHFFFVGFFFFFFLSISV
jgi:hypothetical protein